MATQVTKYTFQYEDGSYHFYMHGLDRRNTMNLARATFYDTLDEVKFWIPCPSARIIKVKISYEAELDKEAEDERQFKLRR